MTHPAEIDALTSAVAVTIARVRCEAIHGQANGGRCLACIEWGTRNASRYTPRFRVTPPEGGRRGD